MMIVQRDIFQTSGQTTTKPDSMAVWSLFAATILVFVGVIAGLGFAILGTVGEIGRHFDKISG